MTYMFTCLIYVNIGIMCPKMFVSFRVLKVKRFIMPYVVFLHILQIKDLCTVFHNERARQVCRICN